MSNKSMKMVAAFAAMVVVLALLVASCGPTPTPEVIEKVVKETVVVEKEVEVTKVVEKEVEVIKEVEKEVEVIKEVEKEVVVTATPEPEKAEPVSGGHLMVGFETTIEDTGDMCQSTSSHSAFLAGNMLDTLVNKHPTKGTYHPGLAKSWEISDDGLSVTLYLRDDVTFHDGTPFNAEAVKFNLDRIMTLPEAKGRLAYGLLNAGGRYEGCEVIDDYTVKLSYNDLYARVMKMLSDNYVGAMHSPTAIEEYGADYGTEIVVGTGPFKWVEWTGPYGELTCERNEEYNWGAEFYEHQGPAYLDGFTFKGIGEPGTRSAAVESGSIDVAWIAEKDFYYFKDLPGFKALILTAKGYGGLLFNFDNPALQDIRVRQAFSHAIDREAILYTPRWSGIGEIGVAFVSETCWGQSLEEFRPYNYWYDLDKANALLEEAGWTDEDGDGIREAHGVEGVEDGTPLHFVKPSGMTAGISTDEVIQAMVRDAGFDLELQQMDWDSRQAAMYEGRFGVGGNDDDSSSFFCIVDNLRTGAPWNFGKYSNPKVDELCDAALGTLDAEEQREYFTEIQKIMLEDVAYIPQIRRVFPYAMREGIEGLSVDAEGVGLYLYEAWINPNP